MRNRGETQKQNKRLVSQIEKDRALISLWYRQGYKISDIHQMLNENLRSERVGYQLTYNMVWFDIKAILQTWREEHSRNINHRIEMELSKLDLIETQMWEAWENSKNGSRRAKMVAGKKKDEQVFKEGVHQTSAGDVKYITRIQWCIEMRAKLLGFYVPSEPQDSGKAKFGDFWEMSTDEIKREMNKLYTSGKNGQISLANN